MAEERVHVSGHSAADPATVWAAAGNFSGAWHPAVAEIRAEHDARGALIRVFAAKGEDAVYREQLVYRSDSDQVLVYTHLEGIAGLKSYVARLAVSADENGGSRIEWSAWLTADDDRVSAIASGSKAIFEMGIEALGKLVAGARVAESSSTDSAVPSDVKTMFVAGNPRLALTLASASSATSDGDSGGAASSLFSPAGGSAQRMRGAEEASEHNIGASRTPSSDPSGHLLPAGEKREETLVLFLHGIGGGRSNWLPQLAAVAPHMRAAALDLRGYGDSLLGPSQSTVDDYCADILRVMETLGAEHLVLCGLSYGSWIATSFAMRHPEKLAGLVLSGGCTGMSETGIEEREAFRLSRQGPLDQGKTPADFAPSVVNVLAGPDAGEDVRQKLFDSMAAIPAASYRDALNCFTNPPERFDFSKLTMPVLMMTGEHDRLAPPAEIRSVANRIVETATNAYVRFEVIAGAGHVCNVERPDAYNAVLTEFLSEVTS